MDTHFSQNLIPLSEISNLSGKAMLAKLGGLLLFLCLLNVTLFAQVKRPDYVEVPCSN